MQVKKQQLEPDIEQWTGSTLGKGYVKALYCHPAYLTYMQSTSCKMPGWMRETSAQAWCTGKTQRDRVEREVGGGIGMGNTCKSMADSCQCMTKTTTIL